MEGGRQLIDGVIFPHVPQICPPDAWQPNLIASRARLLGALLKAASRGGGAGGVASATPRCPIRVRLPGTFALEADRLVGNDAAWNSPIAALNDSTEPFGKPIGSLSPPSVEKHRAPWPSCAGRTWRGTGSLRSSTRANRIRSGEPRFARMPYRRPRCRGGQREQTNRGCRACRWKLRSCAPTRRHSGGRTTPAVPVEDRSWQSPRSLVMLVVPTRSSTASPATADESLTQDASATPSVGHFSEVKA